MLLTEIVKVKWHRKNKEWYINKGYPFTKIKNEFEVKVEDLQTGSNIEVEVLCDYCLEKGIKTIINKKYYKYINSRELVKKDACENCKRKKQEDICLIKNGVGSYSKIKSVSDKISIINKTPYLEILNEFINNDCQLITTEQEYLNLRNKDKLKFICLKHINKGIQYINISNLHTNKNLCSYCSWDELADNRKYDFLFVNNIFDINNMILLEKYYINNHTPMKYICKFHLNTVQQITFSDLLYNNCGCRLCRYEKQSKENHWNWKGGISSLESFLRKEIKLWVKDSLKYYNYKCFITNINSVLVIHHLYPFSKIVKETLEFLNLPLYSQLNKYTNNELNMIVNKCLELHYKYGYGVPLLPEIHELFHKIYGKNNNTLEQFNIFKNNYLKGEFKKQL